jgi:hypothetical protein
MESLRARETRCRFAQTPAIDSSRISGVWPLTSNAPDGAPNYQLWATSRVRLCESIKIERYGCLSSTEEFYTEVHCPGSKTLMRAPDG